MVMLSNGIKQLPVKTSSDNSN